MDKQLVKEYTAAFFHVLAVGGSVIAIIAILVMGLSELSAHASESPRLTPQQVEARRAMHIVCAQGEPYTYSACMVRGLQGQRLGLYVLTAPVPVVDFD